MILVVPCCETGRGGGHLTRCFTLVNELRAIGRDVFLLIQKDFKNTQITNLLQKANFNTDWLTSDSDSSALSQCKMIILDRFQTPLNELKHWKSIAPVIGIDEGGVFRDYFDFLIDILIPLKLSKNDANISCPGLGVKKFTTNHTNHTNITKLKLDNDGGGVRILVTFGQEDAAGLGVKTARSLSAMNDKNKMDVTLLRGAMSDNGEQLAINNIRIIKSIPMLAEHLNEYDLVITHYGITAYEALYAGIPVLLAHPTKYHKKLAKAAGFISFNKRLMKKFTTNQHGRTQIFSCLGKQQVRDSSRGLQLNESSLSGLINSFSPEVNRKCPVCSSSLDDNHAKLITRFSDRVYRRCSLCGIIFMDRTCPPPFEYVKDYFFESYKKQYGKTYLEDFENIKTAAKRRLKIIGKFSRKYRIIDSAEAQKSEDTRPTLLDIGCAYGPFLAAAAEEGFSPSGIDPAEDAVRYVQQTLGIPAAHGFFPDSLPALVSFDIITLWFVIEHFKDSAAVLEIGRASCRERV